MEKTSIQRAKELRQVALRVVYFQDNGEYSYLNKFQEVTSWISKECRELSLVQGETAEDEAFICVSILAGYNVTVRDSKIIQHVMKRAFRVIGELKPSFLKCQLLTYCFGETYDDKLATEAGRIMDKWTELDEDKMRLKEMLGDLKRVAELA